MERALLQMASASFGFATGLGLGAVMVGNATNSVALAVLTATAFGLMLWVGQVHSKLV